MTVKTSFYGFYYLMEWDIELVFSSACLPKIIHECITNVIILPTITPIIIPAINIILTLSTGSIGN